jgi:hypothetical protein
MRTVEYLKTLTYDDMLFLFEKDFSRSAFVFPYYVQHYHDVNLVDIAMYVTKCFVNCFTAKGKRAGTMLSSIDIKNATHKTIADMSMGYDIFGFGVVLLQYLDQTKVFFKSLGTDAKLNFGRILRLGILLCHPDIRKRSSCYSVKDNIKMIENISTKEILHSISYVLKPYFISFDSMYNDDDISNILTHNKIDSSHDRIKNREIFKNEFTPSYYDLSVNMPTSTSTSMSHERINNNITKKHK